MKAADSAIKDLTATGWHERVTLALFVVGMGLLPFSTPATPQSEVVSFGLPFLAALGLIYFGVLCRHPWLSREYLPAIGCGLALLSAQAVSTLYSPTLLPSAARLVPNALGFGVFLYILSPTLFRIGGRTGSPRFVAILTVLVGSAALMATYFVATFLAAVSRWGLGTVIVQRYVGGVMALPWGASNVVASALIYPVFFALYFAQAPSLTKGRRLVFKGVVLILSLAIAMTLSRGAIFATAMGAVTLMSLLNLRSGLKLLGSVALIASAVFGFDYWIASQQLLGNGLFQGFVDRLRQPDVATLNMRTLFWGQYVQLIANAPLLGEGYYSSLALREWTPHNILITTLVERGLIGFVLSAAIVVYAAWQVGTGLLIRELRNRNPVFVYTAAGGVASLVHLMVEDANFTQQYIIYSWVFLGAIFLARRELGRQVFALRHSSLLAAQRRTGSLDAPDR